jgi:hypothetical protein
MDARDRDDKLNETRLAGELRSQLEMLAGAAGAREHRPRRRRLVIVLAVGVIIAVVLGGVSLAGGLDPLRDTFDPLRDTFWPQNEHGQTFGSSGLAKSYEDEPDLIAVASDGKRGYCYKTDLDGPPSTSPGAVSADDLNFPGMRGFAIPMFESDGTTQIGVFWIGGGAGGGGDAGGSRYEQCADAHGTIITTEEAVDGSITITREWLDGRKTTNSAADDPSLSRLDKAERPTTWREITFWFRDDGLTRHGHTSSPPVAPEWLAQRMSTLAREAGDPDATARWTLTYRRCAAPFEGDTALTNDEVKWSVVWIAILHGDFTRQLISAGASPVPTGSYGWIYLLLDKESHEVISEGASAAPFDTSLLHLQGRTDLGEE